MFIGASPSRADNRYDWDRYGLGDPSVWPSYFWQLARIHLGTEHRLSNGVSWRFQTDIRSGIAIPRLTWMPDKQKLRMANHLLDIVQGGEMLVEMAEWRGIEVEEKFRAKAGLPGLLVNHSVTQWDVDLTYAGSRLMSLMNAAVIASAGNKPDALLRGLIFDLERGTIEHARACPGRQSYGFSDPSRDPSRFLFRYGELLNLCDREHYRAFIALVRDIDDKRGVPHLSPSAGDRTKGCIEYPERPVFREEQEYVLYLTFAGLAVQAAGPECAITRTPDNPVIVPYRLLERFMLPGPWRDELLK